ncbi:NACHT and WD domain-containing protein [Apiospora sp. TS-2023a]
MFKRFTSRRKQSDGGGDNADRGANQGLDSRPVSPKSSDERRASDSSDVNLASRKMSATSSDSLSRTKTADSGPLGLNVIYTPDNAHKVDIVFVHGLGGTSRWTWTKHRDPELFWPLTFLPLEPDICLARILTFGYNAGFHKTGNVSTSVFDFAKELLFDLKYGKDSELDDLDMGRAPLIFVVHSLGGLIVKEAYMQGQNDPEYEAIIKAITAICFLATPHRGSTLAQTLNRILDTALVTKSKQYVADLMRNSLTLQSLNDQFRHIAPKLDIVSFYETLPTPIGLKATSVMIVERDSSILGYPGEVSKALVADHHTVCKYDGIDDPNYITIRNVLKTLVSKIVAQNNSKRPELSDRRRTLDLKHILGLSELPGADYIFFRDQWTKGTNQWILEEPNFLEWRDRLDFKSSVLWLSGSAATGKSVLAAHIINNLVENGFYCQYYFIRHGDRQRQTLSLLIRSLALQLAQEVPTLSQKLVEFAEEAINFETIDPRVTWEKIYKSTLFKLSELGPIYWVVDGLDEAQDPRAYLKLLSDISSSLSPIRVLFTSRRSSDISTGFERLREGLVTYMINTEGHIDDLHVAERILESSQNNFLWVRLAVDRINKCYTHAEIQEALQELPRGMEAIYDRMASNIVSKQSNAAKNLSIKILQTLSCAFRTLKVSELPAALGEWSTDMLDLPRTVMDLCGDFVVVDNDGNATLLHLTARDYLVDETTKNRPLCISKESAHKDMFLSSMKCMMSTGLRAKLNRKEWPEFLDYAASYWTSHLINVPVHDQEVVGVLKKFLSGNWMLTWIHALSAVGQLRGLIRASKDLQKFVSRRRTTGIDHSNNDNGAEFLDNEFFDSWGVDLLRIVGRFGGILKRKPDSIYRTIPPFCPKSSSIYGLFGKSEARSLSISGPTTEFWDDSLARISFTQGSARSMFASSIIAAGPHVAVLASKGDVFLHEASDLMEKGTSPLQHGERVDKMQLNSTATLIATYGYKTTKVWEISTGRCIVSADSIESKTRPLTLLFIENDRTLLLGTDDRKVRSLGLQHGSEPTWEIIAELEEPELERHFMNSASHMAFSHDGSLIAVGYRRHPLSAWETDGPIHVGHCRRQDDSAVLRELRELLWHPHEPEVFGVNLEGFVFKWKPYDDDVEELSAAATKLAISKDGSLLATGDGHGRVKLFIASSLTLIHQIAAPDAVFGLSFSPDARRLYDIRGYYANVWEPNALVRLAEETSGDMNSFSGKRNSSSSHGTVMVHGAVDSITSISARPQGRWYCQGTERGVVSLHDVQLRDTKEIYVSKAKFTIEMIAWSSSGNHVCFFDMSKQLTVMLIEQIDGQTNPVVQQRSTVSLRQSVQGVLRALLFNSDSKKIFIHTSLEFCVVNQSARGETAAVLSHICPPVRWSRAQASDTASDFEYELATVRDPHPTGNSPKGSSGEAQCPKIHLKF